MRFRNQLISGVLALAVLFGLGVAGILPPPPPPAVHSATQTVTDLAGRSVTITTNPKAVVGLHAVPDTMLGRLRPDLRKTVQPVSMVRIGVLPQGQQDYLKSLPVINAFYKPTSTETIMSVHPDYIITLTKDPQLEQRSKELGVPVLALKKDTVAELAASWRIMGMWIGKGDEGQAIGDYFEGVVKDTERKVASLNKRKPRVWQAMGISGETPATDTIMTDVLRRAGGEVYWDTHKLPSSEVATNEGLVMPIEELIKFNPEFIFCLNDGVRKAIVNDPRLASVDAVKHSRVFTTLKYARVDSTQSGAACRWLAMQIYPEAFKGEDFFAFMNEYYKVIAGVDVPSDSPLFRELN